MKKTNIFSKGLAVMLALCCLCGTAVSCAKIDNVYRHNSITAASSAADEYAELLAKKAPRLDIPVVIGTDTDGSAYGIDMSEFENDGYIIKTVDGTAFVFGKTTSALTSAVNKFAAMYNSGKVEDVVFHEGYRIEKFEIFGTDISEYVIEHPANPTSYMNFAVSELVQLVRKATGVTLASYVAGTSGADHIISLRVSDNPDFREDGYRYYNENGTLVIEGAARRGCSNGVYRLLQNECGWDELIGGDACLQESDYINIPENIDKSEVPAFDYLYVHAQVWEPFRNDRSGHANFQNTFRKNSEAHHGLMKYLPAADNDYGSQPCFTNEEVYEECLYNIEQYIQGMLAAGYVIGDNFCEIDLGQFDSPYYCACPDCLAVLGREGGNSGAVVRFVNRITDELNQYYPGLAYNIFAYAGTNVPPRETVPNDCVYVTFCFDHNCANHPIDASECGNGTNAAGRKNSDYVKWIEGWCDISDNVFVWFYSLDSNFHDYTVVDTIYKDFTYLHDIGVKGIFWQSTYHGFGVKRVEHQLVYNLNWNIDMTEEEYYDLYEHYLEKEYGAGWEFVKEYVDLMNYAQSLQDCWHCWGWLYPRLFAEKFYNTYYTYAKFDYALLLLEQAIDLAETPQELKQCELLLITALYKGCYSSYFIEYENENTERLAVLSERYDRAMDLMRKYGFTMGTYTTIDGMKCDFQYTSIEDAAWIDWYLDWDALCPNHTRPEPEKYVGLERK